MRILTVAELPGWFDHHIVGSLTDMGHEVSQFSYGNSVGEYYSQARRIARAKKNQALLDFAQNLTRGRGLDLIFCYVYDDFLTIDTARALARMGVPFVNFNVDMVNQWYRQIRTGRYFSYVLCAQKANMSNLARYGVRVLYFPMAGRPQQNLQEDAEIFVPAAPVTFLGSPMPYRVRVLAELERAGIPLAVYGKFWEENKQVQPCWSIEKTISDIYHYCWPRLRGEGFGSLVELIRWRVPIRPRSRNSKTEYLANVLKHGFLSEEFIVPLFKSSAINLGFNRIVGDRFDTYGVNQLKLRDFEVPLAGGFYLVEEAPEHSELFKVGKEIETWRSVGELTDKIRYYLSHDAERFAIAAAGRRRVLADHTWARRFQELFGVLGIE